MYDLNIITEIALHSRLDQDNKRKTDMLHVHVYYVANISLVCCEYVVIMTLCSHYTKYIRCCFRFHRTVCYLGTYIEFIVVVGSLSDNAVGTLHVYLCVCVCALVSEWACDVHACVQVLCMRVCTSCTSALA